MHLFRLCSIEAQTGRIVKSDNSSREVKQEAVWSSRCRPHLISVFRVRVSPELIPRSYDESPIVLHVETLHSAAHTISGGSKRQEAAMDQDG